MFSVLFRSSLSAVIVLALLGGCASSGGLKPFYKKEGLAGLLGPLIPGGSAPAPGEPITLPRGKSHTFWDESGAQGEPLIVIRLAEQRAYFYRGRKLIGSTHVSTGKRGFATPTGSYKVIERDAKHASSLYGDYVGADGSIVKSNVDTTKDTPPPGAKYRGAKMPYFLRFFGGHGLHSGRVPDHPASHGCVRLPSDMAKHFFDNAPLGTPVRVEH